MLHPYLGKRGPKLAQKPAIVIDNGSFEMRAGWSFNEKEGPYLRCQNISSKPKYFAGSGGLTKAMTEMILVGNELIDMNTDREGVKKSMFDKNVVFQKPILENSLDLVFSHIGLAHETSIDFPVMITEPLCNPSYSRAMVNELMFECYNVQALSFGVDSLMAFYGQNHKQKHGLIVSSGYQTSHVIPILNSQVYIELTRRLSLGGLHSHELLSKSLSLRYPQHRHHFTYDAINEIERRFTEVAGNYDGQLKYMYKHHRAERRLQIIEELKKQGEEEKAQDQYSEQVLPKNTPRVIYKNRYDRYDPTADSEDQVLVKTENVIQLPWSVQTYQTANSAIEEAKQEEKRKEQSKKLKEIMEKRRLDK